MEIKEMELEGMSSSELLKLSGKVCQMAMEKMIMEQLEAKLPEIEKRILGAHTSSCLSQLTEQLADEKARINMLLNQEVNLKADRDDLQRQLDVCRKEQKQLEKETAQQNKQLRGLQAAVAEHDQQQKGYLQAVQGGVSTILPFIRTETYEAYVTSLYSLDTIALIYERMQEDCEQGRTENLELYKQLINEFIEMTRRITGTDILQLQQVKLGGVFDSSRFDKTSGSPEIGEISNIIYYGLERDGAVFHDCRSLVEVK